MNKKKEEKKNKKLKKKHEIICICVILFCKKNEYFTSINIHRRDSIKFLHRNWKCFVALPRPITSYRDFVLVTHTHAVYFPSCRLSHLICMQQLNPINRERDTRLTCNSNETSHFKSKHSRSEKNWGVQICMKSKKYFVISLYLINFITYWFLFVFFRL